MERLLTLEEVAGRLNLRRGSLRRLIDQGRLPVVRPTGARALRVAEVDVDRFIRELREGVAANGIQ